MEENWNDKEFVLEEVNKYGTALKYASEELRGDREVVLAALKENDEALQYASKNLSSDKEFIKEVIYNISEFITKQENDGYKLKGFELEEDNKKEINNDKEFALYSVQLLRKYYDFNIRFYESRDKDNIDYAYQYCDEVVGLLLSGIITKDLLQDKEFLLQIANEGNNYYSYDNVSKIALLNADPELLENKEFMLELIKEDESLIIVSGDKLKNNKEFILETLKLKSHYIKPLEYASKELRNDKELRMEQNKELIERLNKDTAKKYYWIFGNDENYNRTPDWSKQKERTIDFMENGFFVGYTKEKIIDILENGFFVGDIEEKPVYNYIITDKDLNVIYAEGDYPEIEKTEYENVYTVGETIVDLDTKCGYDSWEDLEDEQEYSNNKEYILEDVRHNGLYLGTASEDLKNDKEIVLEAIKQNEYALRFASEELRNDTEVVMKAVKQNGDVLVFAGEKFIEENDELLNQYTGLDIKKCYEDLIEWEKSDSSIEYNEACGEYFSMSYFDKVGNNNDKEKLEKACQGILEKINERKKETHQLSEIEETISDRKLTHVNKTTNEIVQANEEKEQEETNKPEYADV